MKPQEVHSSIVCLKQVSSIGKTIPVTGDAPIVWELLAGKLVLRIPVTARLEIYDHGFFRLLHDGKRWTRYGALSSSQTLEWTSDFPCKFRISCEGRTFLLGPENEAGLYAKGQSARLNGREWRLLGTSLGLHVAILGGLIGLLSLPAVQKSIESAVKPKPEIKKVEAKKSASGGIAARPEAKPFQGITYAKFLNLLAAKEFAADPAAVLMKKMQKTSSGGDSPKVAQVGSSLGKVEGAVDSGGTSLSGQVAKEKFVVAESPAGAKAGKKMSDKQMALLKAKFRDLQSDFQRLYSRILVSDPNLSVTISLELLVQKSGYLSVSSFKARGTHRPDSLEKLKKGMTEIIDSAHVGQEFAGITLRGENVFVK